MAQQRFAFVKVRRFCGSRQAIAVSQGVKEILPQELANFVIARKTQRAWPMRSRAWTRPFEIEEDHYRPFLKDSVLPQFEAL